MSGSPIVCCVCRFSKLGWIHFDDAGWACRSCAESADRVTHTYRIGGIRFVKTVKRPINTKAAEVAASTAS